MSNVKTIKDIFAPAFYRPWNDIFYKRKFKICCSGGRGSTKSSFIGYAIFLTLEQDRRTALEHRRMGDPKWKQYLTHAIVYRKTFAVCETSVYAQLQWCAEKLGLTNKYKFMKSPLKIIRNGTGQTILFRGLDDPMKSRSIKFSFSYPKICWFEELSEFDGIEEVNDVSRSVQRGGHDFLTFYSYNPPETSSNWVNFTMSQLVDKDPTFGFYKSDYRTVPKSWLGEQFFHDAEILRRVNERAYRHVYLGEITGNGGTVFPNVKKVNLTDDDIKRFDNIRWGCDFGLRDPTVLIGLHYDSFNHKIIIFDEVYKPDMTLDEMEQEFTKHHFGYEYIVADSAGATLIQSLRARGLQMIPAKKGNDSIMNGIKWLQSLSSIEISSKCENTYKEFVNYEYEKNKMGEFTGRLPDRMNHTIDSCVIGSTKILTNFGPKEIKSLVGTRGKIFGYDNATGILYSDSYEHCWKARENANVYRMEYEGGVLLATEDHKILTPNGYIKLESLQPGDTVQCVEGTRRILSIEYDHKEDVYDIENPKHHNFIIDNGLVVSNCRYACEKLSSTFSIFC